ncbi:MAG: bifunctional diaminohydroxyphosphoribosylaminopyrimidine deaminase/5-amino-6-(5-phosphoribosylamino)uracil reductase RibD [Bacteroidota bacterium]
MGTGVVSPEQQTRHMDRALTLAARGAGAVSPNPMVGAVIVEPDGETILGEGWHTRYGQAHAEVEAVRDAERRGHADRLSQATMVVTLEPCSHTGKTPPCADLIVNRQIPRVIIAHEDPFPEVAGRGIARLRGAGVDVTVGVREHAARRLNEAFLTHVRTNRPLVTMKWALTLDGQVATRIGDSRWITSPDARALVHQWRAEADAVLIGAGTAEADDPSLTVRDVPLAEGQTQPLRVALDRTGGLRHSLRLFTDAHASRTVAVVGSGADPAYGEALTEAGGQVIVVQEEDGHLRLGAVLDALGSRHGDVGPVQSLLVEPGPGLATALLRAGLVDRLFAFIAPKLSGAGIGIAGDLGIHRMEGAWTFVEHEWRTVGPDTLLRACLRRV